MIWYGILPQQEIPDKYNHRHYKELDRCNCYFQVLFLCTEPKTDNLFHATDIGMRKDDKIYFLKYSLRIYMTFMHFNL